MKTLIPTKVATYIFAAVFGIFGIMHLVFASKMQGMVPSYIPGGVFWVYVTGIFMITYAVLVFMNNKYEKLAGYLLALMLVIFALTIYAPNIGDGDPSALPGFLKDIALAAAAIVMANHHDMT